MDKKKYYAVNSSPLSFAMPGMMMEIIPAAPDGSAPQKMCYRRRPRAIEFRENGVEFNVYAPGAKSVEVSGTQGTLWGQEKHPLKEVGDGWWQALITDIPAGVQFTYYFIDGKKVLYEHAPVSYGHNMVCNFVDVPDKNLDFYDWKDVPHGAVRCEFYESSHTGDLRNCWVYTPPGYDREPDKKYPVLYIQHGGGENETGWFWQGKINFIIDNLLARNKCEEMIVVSNFGHAYTPESNEEGVLPGDLGALLMNDCIPFIEKRFRVIPDKSARALCGLSMGSYQTQWIAFNNPDVFDYIGIFSGSVDNAFPEISTAKFLTAENAENFNSQHKLLFYSRGMQEGGERLPGEIEELRRRGIKAEYFTCDGVHEWQVWRKSAHAFVQMIFKNI